LDDLNESLPTEQAKLAAVEQKLAAMRLDLSTAEIDRDISRQERDEDEQKAILDDRRPNPDLGKKVTAAETEVARLRQSVAMAQAAIERQRKTVADIEAAIVARRRETLDRALKSSKIMPRIFADVDRLAADVAELSDINTANGFPEGAPTELILPESLCNIHEPLTNFQARDNFLCILSLALTYRQQSAEIAAAAERAAIVRK
jgi:hypothetical protein